MDESGRLAETVSSCCRNAGRRLILSTIAALHLCLTVFGEQERREGRIPPDAAKRELAVEGGGGTEELGRPALARGGERL